MTEQYDVKTGLKELKRESSYISSILGVGPRPIEIPPSLNSSQEAIDANPREVKKQYEKKILSFLPPSIKQNKSSLYTAALKMAKDVAELDDTGISERFKINLTTYGNNALKRIMDLHFENIVRQYLTAYDIVKVRNCDMFSRSPLSDLTEREAMTLFFRYETILMENYSTLNDGYFNALNSVYEINDQVAYVEKMVEVANEKLKKDNEKLQEKLSSHKKASAEETEKLKAEISQLKEKIRKQEKQEQNKKELTQAIDKVKLLEAENEKLSENLKELSGELDEYKELVEAFDMESCAEQALDKLSEEETGLQDDGLENTNTCEICENKLLIIGGFEPLIVKLKGVFVNSKFIYGKNIKTEKMSSMELVGYDKVVYLTQFMPHATYLKFKSLCSRNNIKAHFCGEKGTSGIIESITKTLEK